MISEPLKQLFDSPLLKVHLHEPAFISGIVLGVSASPEIPMPETWMTWVLKGPHDTPLSSEHVNQLADALIAQLQWQLSLVRNKQMLLPTECIWSDDDSKRAVLEQWLKGLLFAHSQLEDIWFNAWQGANIEEANSRLARCLKCFSVLADSKLALANLASDKQQALKDNLPILFNQLSALLSDYVGLADQLAESLPGQFEMYQKIPGDKS